MTLNSFDDYRRVSSGDKLPPNTIFHYNGQEFETDSLGRSMATRGRIDTSPSGQRLPSVDRAIGQSADAKPGDVGFHRGGDALGFPGGKLNVNPGNGVPDPVNFSETPNLNQGPYKRLENQLSNLAGQGKAVRAEFRAVFNKGNLTSRPDAFTVEYSVNGGPTVRQRFLNQPGG